MILSNPSLAGIIAFDNFDYSDGSLVPNGGWTSHSGSTGDLQISAGGATVQHGVPSEDAHLAFSTISGDIYYGLDFSVNATSTFTGSDSEYFAHFKDAGSNFTARLDVVGAAGGGDYSLGLATDSSTADSIWAMDLMFGATYRAVVKYDQIVNLALLWIDAIVSSDRFISGSTVSAPGEQISQFALRQSDSSLNETIRIDNLVIGTSFADVVQPHTATVPTTSTLFLLLLGLASMCFFKVPRTRSYLEV